MNQYRLIFILFIGLITTTAFAKTKYQVNCQTMKPAKYCHTLQYAYCNKTQHLWQER